MAQTKVQLLQPDLGDVIDFDASTLFVDGADNRIGIRNTNPQYELDVTGTINATNFRGNISVGTIDDWITHTGDTNTKFGFPANDTFAVETAGSERFRVDSNGKLAIGNTSPQQLLHVWPDTANTTSAYVRVTAGDRNSNTGIDIGQDASGDGQVNVVSNGTLTLSTNNTPRIKIANNSAATAIGTNAAYNGMLTVRGDVSGQLLHLKATEDTSRLMVSGTDSNGCEVNLYDDAGGQKGILGVSTGEFFIKAPNSSAPMNFYTHNGSSIGLRLKINSAGDILLGTDQATIGCNTTDGSDNRNFSLCGGSDASQSRGAVVTIYGNEANNGSSQYGTLSLKSGNTNTGFIDFWTQGAKKAEITKDGVFRIQSTYDGSTTTSNAWPALNITNLQGTYTANNILGGVTFGKAAGHTNGIRAGILAIYQGNGSQAGNVGAHLSFRTSANGAGDSTEKLFITDNGVICTGNYRGLLDQTMGAVQINGEGNGGRLSFRGTSGSQYCGLGEMHGWWGSNKVASILFHGGGSNSNKDDGEIRMYTRPVGAGGQERLRINSTGKLLIGTTRTYYANDYYDDITINNSGGSGAAGGCGITMISNDSSWGALQFGDTNDDDCGYIKYDHNQNKFIFGVEDGSVRFWQTKAKTWFGTTGHGDGSRSTLFDLVGDYQDPAGVWTQMGLYSSDSFAQNKGGSIGFGGQDGSTARQQFAAIKGAKETTGSGNYAGYMAFYTRPNGAVTKEQMRITSGGCLSIGTASPGQGSVPGIHIRSGSGDDCRIAFETPSKASSRIGYYGLSNRFGMDVYNGFEIRDVGASYATRLLINSSGNVTFTGELYATGTESRLQVLRNVASTAYTGEFRNQHSVYGGGVQFKSNNTYGTVEIVNYNASGSAAMYNSTGGWHWTGNLQTHSNISPWTDNTHDVGSSSKRWDDIYATNSTIITSDRNEKNTIVNTDLGLSFINKLTPKSYKFNGGTRTHYGLIAQDVETVLSDISKPSSGFAGFIKTELAEEKYDDARSVPEGKNLGDIMTPAHTSYGLRYNEFIAPLIKAIQELSAKVDSLETEVAALKSS